MKRFLSLNFILRRNLNDEEITNDIDLIEKSMYNTLDASASSDNPYFMLCLINKQSKLTTYMLSQYHNEVICDQSLR